MIIGIICYDPFPVRQHPSNRPVRSLVGLFHEDSQFLDIALSVFEGEGATAADMLFKAQTGGCYAPEYAVLLGSVHTLYLDGHPDIVIGPGWWNRHVGHAIVLF